MKTRIFLYFGKCCTKRYLFLTRMPITSNVPKHAQVNSNYKTYFRICYITWSLSWENRPSMDIVVNLLDIISLLFSKMLLVKFKLVACDVWHRVLTLSTGVVKCFQKAGKRDVNIKVKTFFTTTNFQPVKRIYIWWAFVFPQCGGQAHRVHAVTTFLLITLPNIHQF